MLLTQPHLISRLKTRILIQEHESVYLSVKSTLYNVKLKV